MSLTALMVSRLAALGIPARCCACGNTSTDELEMDSLGQIRCQQDEESTRANCRKRIGWRAIDAGGRVVNTVNNGSGITLRAA